MPRGKKKIIKTQEDQKTIFECNYSPEAMTSLKGSSLLEIPLKLLLLIK